MSLTIDPKYYGSSNFTALDSIKLKPSNSVPSGSPTEAFFIRVQIMNI